MIKGKEMTKNIIYRIFSKEEKELLPYVQKAEIVSFDVFDTLIKRDVVDPADVFTLMEQILLDEGKPYAHGFAQQRKNAEQEAKTNLVNKEITLQDIYDRIQIGHDDKQEIIQLEYKIEIELSTPNTPIQHLYQECVKRDSNIIFISDMYLPTYVIQEILEKNGYRSGRLYVSSDCGCTKRSGKLFSYIQKRERFDNKKWCHIGDHILSDYLIPKGMGIHACLIDREPKNNIFMNRKFLHKSSDYRQLNHYINIRLNRYIDLFERIGYAVLGPLLYGFSNWLEKEIPSEMAIAFLAREGRLLQRAFSIISDRPSVYLFTSRSAVMGAYLSQLENESQMSQIRLWTIRKGHTQKELALSYGLSIDEVKIVFSDAALSEDAVLTSVEMEEQVQKAVWPVAHQKAYRQHQLLQKYIEQIGLSERYAAVDVGWRGTILMLLNGAKLRCGEQIIHWDGYYMGVHEKPDSNSYYETKIRCFLYDKSDNPHNNRIRNVIRSTLGFFETMFLATDGTTESYEEDESGWVYPVQSSPDNENLEEVEKIHRMQEAGLRFVSDLHMSPTHKLVTMSTDESIENYIAFAKQITPKKLRAFRALRVGGGDKVTSLVNEHGLVYYILHPKRFVEDFKTNECKAWFMKGVFKLPMPYLSILSGLRYLSSGRKRTD